MAKEAVCVECGEYKTIEGKGMCRCCYKRKHYESNREKIKERSKKYYEENKENKKKYQKKYYEENKEAASNYGKRWREVNKEYMDEYRKTYYQGNRERINERSRRWRENNKTRMKEILASSRHKRRAKLNGAESEKISQNEVFERDNWMCGICGERVDKNLKFPNVLSASLDHIVPLNKGGTHTYDNVQLAHFGCNSRKSDKVDFIFCK